MRLQESNRYVSVDGDRFDVLKFILAVFILGIHTDVSFTLKPVFRLAVPLFFMMTSYFFFLKQARLDSLRDKRHQLKNYCLRILKLYLFWFIVLLPLTVYYHKWYVDPGPGLLLDVVHSFLFGNTFKASWFLMASLLCIVLVWYLSRWVKTGMMLALGVVLYCYCCLTTNYYHLCEGIPGFTEFNDAYVTLFKDPYHSFPVAFAFVVIGKYLAEHSVTVSNRVLGWVITVCLVLLYAEQHMVVSNHWVSRDDCFFSLLPMSVGLFMLIGQNHVRVGVNAVKLRKCSTIIFCSHYSLAVLILHLLRSSMPGLRVGTYDLFNLLTFAITLLLCLGLCELLLWLEKREHFAWIKYCH